MQKRWIGPFQVSSLGLGCMSLSHAYGTPPSEAVAEALLLRALELGVTLFDTAALYGFGANEAMLGRVLAPHRSRIILASKGGMTGVNFSDGIRRVIDGRPESLKRDCEASLRRLRTDAIDLYYLHRWDRQVPIEDSVGALAELVAEGKIRAIGLSEVSAATLRRAHAIHPISAVQTEYSLWTRNPEIAVLETCRELGAAFVALSPLARGYLPGTLCDLSVLDDKDIRRAMPRFASQHYPANLKLLDGLAELAHEVGCSMAQLALSWLLVQGEHIVPIPGTTRLDHLEENIGAADLGLEPATIQRIGSIIGQHNVAGARYGAATQTEIDTEEFAEE